MRKMTWESWLILAVGVAVLFFGVGNFWSATWLSKWALILTLAAAGFSGWVARRTSWFYFPGLLYCLVSMLAIAAWPYQPFLRSYDIITLMALQKNAFSGVLEVVACTALFALITQSMKRGILVFLSLVWAVGTFALVTLPHPALNGLWFGNPSMAAGLLACLLPIAWGFTAGTICRNNFRAKMAFMCGSWLLTLLMIWRTEASVPWGVLGVTTAAVFVARTPRKAWLLSGLGTLLLAGLMLLVSHKLLGGALWGDSGRFMIWRMAIDCWDKSGSTLLGMGFSTSQILLPIQQVTTNHFGGEYFMWLHNDWLQILTEGGIVGWLCIAPAVARLASVAWPRPALFGALMGFCTLGLFNYPLRMPIHCLCIVLVCGLAEALVRKPSRETLSSASRLTSAK